MVEMCELEETLSVNYVLNLTTA